jgi:hypothetical protein
MQRPSSSTWKRPGRVRGSAACMGCVYSGNETMLSICHGRQTPCAYPPCFCSRGLISCGIAGIRGMRPERSHSSPRAHSRHGPSPARTRPRRCVDRARHPTRELCANAAVRVRDQRVHTVLVLRNRRVLLAGVSARVELREYGWSTHPKGYYTDVHVQRTARRTRASSRSRPVGTGTVCSTGTLVTIQRTRRSSSVMRARTPRVCTCRPR